MKLFLDMDGVLADFDAGAKAVLGVTARYFSALHGEPEMWRRLRAAPRFYAELPLVADAYTLWNGVKRLHPTILTGVPSGGWAGEQKLEWRDNHFPGTAVVTCPSRDKATYCRPGDVLIDDRPKYQYLWEAAGGTFIVHQDAGRSLLELAKVLAGRSRL